MNIAQFIAFYLRYKVKQINYGLKNLNGYRLKKIVTGCVHGDRYMVPYNIQAMQTQAKYCNRSSPWFGNKPPSNGLPGLINSDGYYAWRDEIYGEVDYEDDPIDYWDYDYYER